MINTKDLDAIFADLEDPETIFMVNLASGFHVYVDIVDSLPAYQRLKAAIETDFVAKAVVQRLSYLLTDRGDEQYAHPHDDSIAIYILSVMDDYPHLLAPRLIEKPSHPTTGLFWARMAALHWWQRWKTKKALPDGAAPRVAALKAAGDNPDVLFLIGLLEDLLPEVTYWNT